MRVNWAQRFRRTGCQVTLHTLSLVLAYDWLIKNSETPRSSKIPSDRLSSDVTYPLTRTILWLVDKKIRKLLGAQRFRRTGCQVTLHTLVLVLSYDWSIKNFGKFSGKFTTVCQNRTYSSRMWLLSGVLRPYQYQDRPSVNESIQHRQTAAWGGARKTEKGEWHSEEETATFKRGRLQPGGCKCS